MRVLVLLGLLTTYVLPLGARPVAVYTGVATEWAVDDVVHSDRIAIAPSVCAVFGGPESKRGRVGVEYLLGLWSHYDTRENFYNASSVPPGYTWTGHRVTDQDGWFGSYEGIRVVGRDFHRGQPSGIKAGLGVGLHQLWPIVQPDRFAERRTLGALSHQVRMNVMVGFNFWPRYAGGPSLEVEATFPAYTQHQWQPRTLIQATLGWRFTI